MKCYYTSTKIISKNRNIGSLKSTGALDLITRLSFLIFSEQGKIDIIDQMKFHTLFLGWNVFGRTNYCTSCFGAPQYAINGFLVNP